MSEQPSQKPSQEYPKGKDDNASSSELTNPDNETASQLSENQPPTNKTVGEGDDNDTETVEIEFEDFVEIWARQSSIYSGPYPPPEVLGQLDKIVPGSAKQIVAEAKKEAEHRRKIEEKMVDANVKTSDTNNKRSMWGVGAGFTLSALAIIGGLVAILFGHDSAGATIATGTIVALATVFVYGTSVERQNRKKTNQQVRSSKEENG